jgi:hypothetical protein
MQGADQIGVRQRTDDWTATLVDEWSRGTVYQSATLDSVYGTYVEDEQ